MPATCAHCGRPLTAADGSELRGVDVRSKGVEARQCERFRRLLIFGTPAAAVIAVGMPLLHLGAVAMAPLWAVLHLLIVRFYLTSGTFRLLSPVRRRFNRWLGRFTLLWLGVPGYAAMATPAAGVLVGAATFAGLTALIHRYALWSLHREAAREPLTGWEKALLGALGIATVAGLILVVALAALLGWSVASLLAWLGSRTS